MLAPRSVQKSMPTSKGRFCQNYCKTNEVLMIFQGYGVEVGSKNQSKIHQKIKPKMDCLLASTLLEIEVGRYTKTPREDRHCRKCYLQKGIWRVGDEKQMRFSIDLFSLLARFCTPTCFPKPTNIHQKSMLRGHPSWASTIDRFLIDFGCQLQCNNKLENH